MSVTSERVTSIPRSWWTRVGFLLATFSLLAFIAAFDEPTLLQIDLPLQGWIVDARQGWLNDVMWGVTFLGTRYFIGAVLLGFTIWSFATGRCRVALVVFVLAFAFNPLIEWALKAGVDRVRPEILPLGPGRGPSFPSGHVLASVGFYGLLPAFASLAGAGRRAKQVAAAAAIGVIVAIGISRMYIGVHWFSDVIGGMLIGSVLVVVTYRLLHRHRIVRCTAARCAVAPAPFPDALSVSRRDVSGAHR